MGHHFRSNRLAAHNYQTKATMKVFATLATILGVAYAAPEADAQMGLMRSGLQRQNNVMHMSAVMPNMKMRLSTPYQAHNGPSQYHLQDEFGNFEYAYANQDSKKMEKGNDMSVRGQYAYIMSDGLLRRVDYIADNSGFHVLQDNADSSRSQNRIKRSVEPDLIRTRMTSFMDSSSLKDDSNVNPNMYNMMGRDMSSNNMMQRHQMNDMSSNRNIYGMMDRSSNMMNYNMMNNNMRNNNMMNNNMMYNNMMNNNMKNENMMGRNMMNNNMNNENMFGHNMMYNNMLNNNMKNENMMGRNMMNNNMMNRNMVGQDMSSMMNENMMGNRMNAYGNDVNSLLNGQRNTMSQRMQIEQIPQSVASNRFF